MIIYQGIQYLRVFEHMRYIADVLKNICGSLYDVAIIIFYLITGFAIILNIANDFPGFYLSFI